VLTTHEFDPRLDLPTSRGQRSATFRFELLDGVTGQPKRELNPIRDSPPTLTHDTSRTIKRGLSSLLLERADTAAVNPVRDRVRVSMILSSREWPLGTYMFTNFTQVITTSGDLAAASLLDEMFAVDQPIDRGFASRQIPNIEPAYVLESAETTMERLLDEIGVSHSIEPTAFSAIGSWPIGTNRGRIIEELALVGDYFSPWFTHDNVFRCVRAFDPAQRVVTFDWDSYDVVIRDSISYTNDLLTAPNRIVVVSNATSSSANTAAITGTFDISAAAPHSITNRGFVVADVRNMPVDDAAQASVIAANIGQRETVAERIELDTPPDPRHESYDVIRWEGENWLELSWSMVLTEGGTMHHVLRKAYS
jgi:hypothetical protein